MKLARLFFPPFPLIGFQRSIIPFYSKGDPVSKEFVLSKGEIGIWFNKRRILYGGRKIKKNGRKPLRI